MVLATRSLGSLPGLSCCYHHLGISSTGRGTSDCFPGWWCEWYLLHHALLSIFLMKISGYKSIIRSILVLSWDECIFMSWKIWPAWYVLGTVFRDCSMAIPLKIQTADAGTSSIGSAFSSKMCSSLALTVFVGTPSGVARNHGKGPSRYFKTLHVHLLMLSCHNHSSKWHSVSLNDYVSCCWLGSF